MKILSVGCKRNRRAPFIYFSVKRAIEWQEEGIALVQVIKGIKMQGKAITAKRTVLQLFARNVIKRILCFLYHINTVYNFYITYIISSILISN